MIGHKLQSAIDKRASLLGAGTDALRLIDGEGDSLPGLYLDTLAGRWLVSTTASEVDTEVLTWLQGQGDQGRTIYWKRCLKMSAFLSFRPDFGCQIDVSRQKNIQWTPRK